MLVPDLLHEFELGVWKSLFTHLIRILYAHEKGKDTLVRELNLRYGHFYGYNTLEFAKFLCLDLRPFSHLATVKSEDSLRRHLR